MERQTPIAIFYLNELFPGVGDIANLRREIDRGRADVTPAEGSEAERLLASREDATSEHLPLAFRLERAIRVYAVSDQSVADALGSFDEVVERIENCRNVERQTGVILSAWDKNASDENTCAACDAQTFCPSYSRARQPILPASGTRGS